MTNKNIPLTSADIKNLNLGEFIGCDFANRRLRRLHKNEPRFKGFAQKIIINNENGIRVKTIYHRKRN